MIILPSLLKLKALTFKSREKSLKEYLLRHSNKSVQVSDALGPVGDICS